MGPSQISSIALAKRLAVQPSCLALQTDRTQVVAFSVVYRLSRRGLDAVLAKEVVGGAALDHSHLQLGTGGAAIYIGACVGDEGHNLDALALTARHLRSQMEVAPEAEWAFARVATDAGGRLLDRMGFDPLGPPSEIAARSIHHVDWALADLEERSARSRLSYLARSLRRRR